MDDAVAVAVVAAEGNLGEAGALEEPAREWTLVEADFDGEHAPWGQETRRLGHEAPDNR